MATRPPAPPPRGPNFTPPRGEGSRLATVIKVVAWVFGGAVVMLFVGTGLLFATCAGSR